MKNLFRAVFGTFKWLFNALSFIRSLVLNLLFFGIVALIIGSLLYRAEQEPIEPGILKLTLSGDIVEQTEGNDPLGGYIGQFLGIADEPAEISLQDILDVIDQAKDDPRILGLLLDIADLGHAGLNQLQEIGVALNRFRESGKPVIAAEDYYSQSQYLLAAHAYTIFLNLMGGVNLNGFGLYRTYYKDILDKLKVNFHVFQVGAYKSALEPFIRNSMSPEDRSQSRTWLTALWSN